VTQALTKPKLFLDSAALISAIISPLESPPIKRIIALGEAQVLDLRVSREVIQDVERFIRARNATLLPRMAQAMTQGRMAEVLDPNKETVDFCETITNYRPDARILAAAIESDVDILVTYDSQHLLANPKIAPPDVRVMVMNPKDALEWCFEQWTSMIESRGL
jgi:predicted nucleic acid-binding protein